MKEIRYEYKPEIARCAMTAAFARALPKFVIAGVVALVLSAVAYLLGWGGVSETFLRILLIGLIVFLIMVPIMIFSFTMKTTNEWKKVDDKFTLVQFFDDKITVKAPLASSDILWTAFSRFSITKKYGYLWYRDKICVIIPISFLDDELKSFISSKITSQK